MNDIINDGRLCECLFCDRACGIDRTPRLRPQLRGVV